MDERPVDMSWWIDFATGQPYEWGALLLALLAFPEIESTDQFDRVHQSICATALMERARTIPEFANSYHQIKPIHFARTEDQRAKDLRTFRRRLRDRMLAGRLCNVKLAHLAGNQVELPVGVNSTSINQLIGLTLADLGSEDAENQKERIWRQSSPVIHLAAAVQSYLAVTSVDLRPKALGDLVFQRSAIEFVTHLAKDNALLIQSNAKRLDMETPASLLVKILIDPPDKKIRIS